MVEPATPGYASASSRTERSRISTKLQDLYKQDPNIEAWSSTATIGRPARRRDRTVSAAFLPSDSVVVTPPTARFPFERSRRRQYYQRRRRRRSAAPAARCDQEGAALIVLVNEGVGIGRRSSPARSGYHRGTIMGAQTFGKSSVQAVRQLSPETALKVTTARYYTPTVRRFRPKGIVPDVMLDETAEGDLLHCARANPISKAPAKRPGTPR